ncbi:MAG: S41 family peptidase [Patescibacteria group bacterium]|nr:S41 family peptidase [Patescibacteria group bacterium]
MPHRNLMVLLAAAVLSILCHHRVESNRYGRILSDALRQIERRYVQPVEPKDLFDGAMEGMLGVLNDPYSRFVTSAELNEFNESLNQEFGGVGMEVSQDAKTKQLRVVSPLFGTPAYQAGIRAGDRILRIEGQATDQLALIDAVRLMRGQPGTTVTLEVLHVGAAEPVELLLRRRQIPIDTILGDTRNQDGTWNFTLEDHPEIGYVRINAFSHETASHLRKVLQALLDGGMEKLILDLRNDPGGLLDAAVALSDMFIREGLIVSVRRRDRSEDFIAAGAGVLRDFPLVILVNQHSASASEIFAACLKDHGRAKIAGQRTYGKGTVQQVVDLEGGLGAIKLTTADYWRPNGRNINRSPDSTDEEDWGVCPSPGLEVVLDDEEFAKFRIWRLRRDVPQGSEPEEVEGDEDGNDEDGNDEDGNDEDGNDEDGGEEDNSQAEPDANFVDRQLARAVEYLTGNL